MTKILRSVRAAAWKLETLSSEREFEAMSAAEQAAELQHRKRQAAEQALELYIRSGNEQLLSVIWDDLPNHVCPDPQPHEPSLYERLQARHQHASDHIVGLATELRENITGVVAHPRVLSRDPDAESDSVVIKLHW